MKPVSLFELGVYSSKWIKDFYNQAGVDPHAPRRSNPVVTGSI